MMKKAKFWERGGKEDIYMSPINSLLTSLRVLYLCLYMYMYDTMMYIYDG